MMPDPGLSVCAFSQNSQDNGSLSLLLVSFLDYIVIPIKFRALKYAHNKIMNTSVNTYTT